MAEVFPQTSFWLFFDVPLSPTYENTFYFANATEQQNYFLTTFSNIVFSAQSYQRKSRGRIRVKANYGQVYNANYLAFINMNPVHTVGTVPSYEQKRYYCFVTDVEYVNDAVCDIYYTLDVLQSFMFDWQFEQAMVERETTISDNLYEHIIDEGLPIGDYVFANASRMKFRKATASSGTFYHLSFNPKVVIAATVNDAYEDSTDGAEITKQYNGGTNGVIVGCNMLVKDLGTTQSSDYALYWLNNLPGEKQQAILGIYMVPLVIAENPNTGEFVAHIEKPGNSLGTYTPQNKKLLTFPYNSLYVISSDGTSKVFDYSKFYDQTEHIRFYLDIMFTPPIQGTLYPANYSHEAPIVETSAIPLPTMPSCTWSNDTYKAWAAMNTGFMISSIAASAVDVGMQIGSAYVGGAAANALGIRNMNAASTAGSAQEFDVAETQYNLRKYNTEKQVVGGIVGDIQNIANNFLTMRNAMIAPDAFNGSAENLAAIANGYYGYAYAQRVIRPEYARIIDQFFTMFGYKVLTVKVPSIHNRTRFTYVKTSNLDIKGRIPSVYRRQICDIFNAGIRWWVDRAHIGDYSYINAPLQ